MSFAYILCLVHVIKQILFDSFVKPPFLATATVEFCFCYFVVVVVVIKRSMFTLPK